MNRFESYSKRLKWAVPFLLTAFVTACGGGGSQDPILGTGGNAVLAPTVTTVTPSNNATGVSTNNAVISIAFNQAMNPITGAASFKLTCAAPCVNPTGTVALDATNKIATFTPATTLTPLTLYTATVAGATSLATGVAIESPHVWTFTTAVTDTTRPGVTLTVPATATPGPTTGVATNSAITAVFTEDMAPATITSTNFTVTCASPCVTPTGTVSYAASSRTAVFTPASALAADSTYTGTVTTGATDLAGNALGGNQGAFPAASNHMWTFTTAAVAAPAGDVSVSSTNPSANSANICTSGSINATFSVPSGLRMDPLTVDATTFTVTGPAPGLTPVIATSVRLDVATGRIATFTPLTAFTAGVTYTATIKGGVIGAKDLSVPANAMASDFSWTFIADDCATPNLAAVALGSVSTFGTFGGSAGTTNQGILTIINGDIGTTAVSTAVTGFHDAGVGCIYTETPLNVGVVNGMIYTAPPSPTVACPDEGTAVTFAVASEARADALTAYNALVAKAGGPDPGAGNLANLVLVPGVYTAASGSFMIEGGDLTLDAQGNANAVWVFQMATTLTVGGPGAAAPQSIILVNGAQAKNVFWQVGSAATINAAGGGTMVGTIIAQEGAAISTSGNVDVVTLNGRVLSLGASVTLVNTVINVPAP